jgi:hypothetical protein
MGDAKDVLLRLFFERMDQKRYVDAVACLLAVCGSNQILPTTKATCRLIAARIVLDHCDNVAEAMNYLRTAVGNGTRA